MSNVFVVAYHELATASRVRDRLFEMNRENLVELEDAVVVERRPDGHIKLHQAPDHTTHHAAGGPLWGGTLGLLFLAPLLGTAVGTTADTGLDDAFLRELRHNLRPGAAALFVLIRQAASDKIIPELARYGGQLVRTSLRQSDEDHLREALQAARAPHPVA